MKIFLLLLFLTSTINIFSQDKIEFQIETLENENYSFSEMYSKGPALVNFWALWCKPCRAEMRHLQQLFEKYNEYGFSIIGINQDSPRSLAKVKSFVLSHNISFPIMTDPNQEIFQKFNSQSIPLSILYDKEGKVVYSHLGYLPGDEIELEAEIKNVLGIDK